MGYKLTDAHKLVRNTAWRIARERLVPRAADKAPLDPAFEGQA